MFRGIGRMGRRKLGRRFGRGKYARIGVTGVEGVAVVSGAAIEVMGMVVG